MVCVFLQNYITSSIQGLDSSQTKLYGRISIQIRNCASLKLNSQSIEKRNFQASKTTGSSFFESNKTGCVLFELFLFSKTPCFLSNYDSNKIKNG